MDEIINYFLDYIFPRVSDQRFVAKDDLKGNSVNSIHNYLEGAVWNSGIIWQCYNSSMYYPVIYFGLYGDNAMKNLIQRAKFKAEWAIAKEIGKQIGIFLLKNDVNSLLLDAPLVLTYIPPDKKRMQERGFHIPLILAKQAFRVINKNNPTSEYISVLYKNKNTDRQTNLSKTDRQTNIKNKFSVNKNINLKKWTENTVILIIDDVTTTGSTIQESAKTILDFVKTMGLPLPKIIGVCWLWAE